jgi:hypothetical protein
MRGENCFVVAVATKQLARKSEQFEAGSSQPVIRADDQGLSRQMMAAVRRRFRQISAAGRIGGQDIPHDLVLDGRRGRQCDVPVTGFSHVDVLQHAVEVSVALHRRSHPAGEIEIPQVADIVGNDRLDDRIN